MPTRSIVPRENLEGEIGTSAKQWLRLWAAEANINGFYIYSNKIEPTVDNSMALGTVSNRFSEVHAVTFYGTATKALYADLAENFTIKDTDVPPGSVISVSDGQFDAELCQEDCCEHVIGVISENPAYVMNTAQKEGKPICVKGRVRVRILGPVSKKQVIVSAGNGCARAIENMNEKLDKIGVALATDSSEGEKLVECFIY